MTICITFEQNVNKGDGGVRATPELDAS